MYKLHRIAVLLVVILVVTHELANSAAYAVPEGTYVGGRIKRDTTWAKEGGPYILNDDLIIQQGACLTIEGGATVNLTLWSITVEGELRAVGTPDEKIFINIPLTTLKENRNGRIYFTPESRPYKETGQGCLLEYVVIKCMDYAISYGVIKGRQLKLDHVEIHGGLSHWKEPAVKMNGTVTNCLFNGTYRTIKMGEGTITNNRFVNTRYGLAIDIEDGVVRDNVLDSGVRGIGVMNALVKNNTIIDMEIVGISIHSGRMPYTSGELRSVIVNNVIMRCQKAVTISGDIRPVINNNIFLENTYGIYFDVEAFYGGAKPRIENNAFYDNEYNVYMYREDPRITVSVPNNWWGTNNHEIIEEKIYDVNDNPRLCSVKYTPILSEPPSYLPKIPYRLTVSSPRSTIKLRETVEISGKIVPPLKVLNVQVICVGPDGTRIENALSTNSEGEFSYTFTPSSIGVWSITVASEGSLLTDSDFEGIQVDVTKIDSLIELDYAPKPCFEDDLVTVNGVLTPSKSNEVIGIIVVHPDGSGYNEYMTTDSGGVFTYKTYGTQQGIYTATFTWHGTDEYVGSAETISYRVQSPSGLKIIVEDEGGGKIVNAAIESAARPEDQGTLTGVTDSGGSLVFTEIAAGDYTFTVEKSGYEPRTLTLSLSEGETPEIKTTLSETRNIPASYTPPTGEEEPSPKNDQLILGFIPSILTFGILITLYILVRRRAQR
jgi:hypothetical protein